MATGSVTSPMTDDEIRRFIANSRWRFAKSMPEMPHEYTRRADASDDAEFCRFVMHIRQAGYKGKFGKTTYKYLDVDGWQYWTMGAPLNKTILINRATLNEYSS